MIEKGKYNEKAANEGKTIEMYTQRDTTMDFADYKGKDRRLGPEQVNYVPQITQTVAIPNLGALDSAAMWLIKLRH